MRTPAQDLLRVGQWTPEGPTYGTVSTIVWEAGDQRTQSLVQATRALALWRVSVVGDLLVEIDYGTSQKTTVRAVAPLVAQVPGNVWVRATPRDAAHGQIQAKVSIVPLPAGEAWLRARATVGALQPNAVRFVALTLATLDVQGVPVALGVGDSIDVTGDSTALVAGEGIEVLAL